MAEILRLGMAGITRRLVRAAVLGAVCLAALAPAREAGAHPHAWIDVAVEVRFDADGRVSALTQTWLFDEFYTAFALEALGKSPTDTLTPADFAPLLEATLGELRAFDYFTTIRQGEVGIPPEDAVEPEGAMQDGRWQMRFTVALPDPVTPGPAGLVYAIYDPSYFVEMLHIPDGEPIRLVNAPPGCSTRKIRPEPDFEALALAAAADAERPDGETQIGALFAEQVFIQCP